jgi:CRISPR type III-B/RAMP module-associated protein Cmr3
VKRWALVTFEPLDVLAAADSRPLELGGFGHDGALAPAAFAGALRTAILRTVRFDPRQPSARATDAARFVGHPDHIEEGQRPGFCLAGPLLRDETGSLLLPAPRSTLTDGSGLIVEHTGPQAAECVADQALDGCKVLSSQGSRNLRPAEGWVLAPNLGQALLQVHSPSVMQWQDNHLPDGRPVRQDELLLGERRYGHTRSDRLTAQDGMLFSRAVVRPRHSVQGGRLAGAAYAGLVDPETASRLPSSPFVVRLGGDGHLARVTVDQDSGDYLQPLSDLAGMLPELLKEHGGLVVYLATPALFDAGWRPKVRASLSLVAAAVGRPLTIAGWDQARRRPKPVLRAVPAGSVYFFRLVSAGDAATIVAELFMNESISDRQPETGLGLAVLGVWNARDSSDQGGGQ